MVSAGCSPVQFITWLALKDRLSTGVRMRVWGQSQSCLLRGEPEETRNHFFFACPYTFTLWLEVTGNLLLSDASPDWDTTLDQLRNRSQDLLSSILLRLALQVSVYYIWREPNERRHSHKYRAVGQLVRIIDKTVRNRIMSTRYFEKPKLYGLMQRWFGSRILHT